MECYNNIAIGAFIAGILGVVFASIWIHLPRIFVGSTWYKSDGSPWPVDYSNVEVVCSTGSWVVFSKPEWLPYPNYSWELYMSDSRDLVRISKAEFRREYRPKAIDYRLDDNGRAMYK